MAWVLIIALGVALAGAVGCFVSRALCAGGSCPITSKRLLVLAMVAVFGVWLAVSGCSKAGTADEGGVDADSDSPAEFD